MLDQIAARRKARLERYNARVAELQAIADARRRMETESNAADKSGTARESENAEKTETQESGVELRARVVSALRQ